MICNFAFLSDIDFGLGCVHLSYAEAGCNT
jgi:hypothetical protein